LTFVIAGWPHAEFAIHGNRKAMDRFVQMNAGTISPVEFLAPESTRAITATAQRAD
jgi:hypothetical protein